MTNQNNATEKKKKKKKKKPWSQHQVKKSSRSQHLELARVRTKSLGQFQEKFFILHQNNLSQ